MGDGGQGMDDGADQAGTGMRRTVAYVEDFIHLKTAAGSLADQSAAIATL